MLCRYLFVLWVIWCIVVWPCAVLCCVVLCCAMLCSTVLCCVERRRTFVTLLTFTVDRWTIHCFCTILLHSSGWLTQHLEVCALYFNSFITDKYPTIGTHTHTHTHTPTPTQTTNNQHRQQYQQTIDKPTDNTYYTPFIS